jgi:hypothetical protein
MSTSYSTSLKLALIGTGDQSGTWGTTTNTNFGTLLEQAITGVEGINVSSYNSSSTPYTLTNYNGTTDDARNAVLVFTGTPAGSVTIIAPLVNKLYTVVNQTSQSIFMTATGGLQSLTVPANTAFLCYCDASGVTTGSAGFFPQATGTSGPFNVNGALTVTGNETIGGTLSVTGTTTLSAGGTSTTPSTGDSTTKIATTAFVTTALQAMYPVGSIYMNTSSSTNPGTLFGFGTWTALAPGQMLLGNGGGYTAGATGGSATTTIGLSNIPAHTHSITDPGHLHSPAMNLSSIGLGYVGSGTNNFSGGGSSSFGYGGTAFPTATATTGVTATNNTQSGGTAFPNTAMTTISPYLVVYMWQRTA